MNRVTLTITFFDETLRLSTTQTFGPFPRERAFELRTEAVRRGFVADLDYVDPVSDLNTLLKNRPVLYTVTEASQLSDGLGRADEALINRHDTLIARRYRERDAR